MTRHQALPGRLVPAPSIAPRKPRVAPRSMARTSRPVLPREELGCLLRAASQLAVLLGVVVVVLALVSVL